MLKSQPSERSPRETLFQSIPAMYGDDATGQVEVFHALKSRGLEHRFQLGLRRMHADAFGIDF